MRGACHQPGIRRLTAAASPLAAKGTYRAVKGSEGCRGLCSDVPLRCGPRGKAACVCLGRVLEGVSVQIRCRGGSPGPIPSPPHRPLRCPSPPSRAPPAGTVGGPGEGRSPATPPDRSAPLPAQDRLPPRSIPVRVVLV